jgi:hypothetical protein
MPAPIIRRHSDSVTLGSIDQMAIVYFPAKSPSAAEITIMQAHLFQVALQAPDGFGLLLVVPETGGPPDGKARELATEMFRSLKGRLKVFAGVLEGGGFGAAAKRSVLTMLGNVAMGSGTIRVFSAVPPGCDWLAQQAKLLRIVSPESFDLQATVALMRNAP